MHHCVHGGRPSIPVLLQKSPAERSCSPLPSPLPDVLDTNPDNRRRQACCNLSHHSKAVGDFQGRRCQRCLPAASRQEPLRGRADGNMEQITATADRETMPLWSWMGYNGGIRYMGSRFGTMEWNNLPSALIRGEGVPTRAFFGKLKGTPSRPEIEIVFDRDGLDARLADMRCLVLGKKSESSEDIWSLKRPPYWVLLLLPLAPGDLTIYERAGVSSIEREWLSEETNLV